MIHYVIDDLLIPANCTLANFPKRLNHSTIKTVCLLNVHFISHV